MGYRGEQKSEEKRKRENKSKNNGN